MRSPLDDLVTIGPQSSALPEAGPPPRGILDPLTKDEEVALALKQRDRAERERAEALRQQAELEAKAQLFADLDGIDAELDEFFGDLYKEYFVPITDQTKADFARFKAHGKHMGLPTGIPNLASPDDIRALAISITHFLVHAFAASDDPADAIRLHDSIREYMRHVFGSAVCDDIRVRMFLGVMERALKRKQKGNGNDSHSI